MTLDSVGRTYGKDTGSYHSLKDAANLVVGPLFSGVHRSLMVCLYGAFALSALYLMCACPLYNIEIPLLGRGAL